jgi:hypothetical protein
VYVTIHIIIYIALLTEHNGDDTPKNVLSITRFVRKRYYAQSNVSWSPVLRVKSFQIVRFTKLTSFSGVRGVQVYGHQVKNG